MPRQVDHADRRDQIVDITIELIAESGPNAVTIREVARRLGGSVTLVTHYYPSRQAIFEGVAEHLIELGRSEVAALEADTEEPFERLRRYMTWALPTRKGAIRREQARIRLLAEREAVPSLPHTSRAFDGSMREDLAHHLQHLVPDDERDLAVELLRVFITGTTILAVEHEDQWTPERQMALADSFLETLGIRSQASAT